MPYSLIFLVVCPDCGYIQRQTVGEDVTHCIRCGGDLTLTNEDPKGAEKLWNTSGPAR